MVVNCGIERRREGGGGRKGGREGMKNNNDTNATVLDCCLEETSIYINPHLSH